MGLIYYLSDMRTLFGRVVRGALGILALALVSAQFTPGIAASADGTAPEGPRASTRSPAMQWGAFVQGPNSQTTEFEAMVGRKMDLYPVFVAWEGHNSAFPEHFAPFIRDAGKTMVIFWEGMGSSGSSSAVDQPRFNHDSIIRGSWDANIRINADIVIGENNGEENVPMIGNSVVIEPGAKIFGKIIIADGIHIGANSVVNKSFTEPNVVIVGAPARVVRKI